MFKQRLITALILIPIVLAIVYFSKLGFLILTSFILLLASWEWSALMKIRGMYRLIYIFFLACILFISAITFRSEYLFWSFIWWILATLMVIFYPGASSWWRNSPWVIGIMGMFVLVPTWLALNYLRSIPQGVYTLLFLFAIIWGGDTVAYLIGRKWGKRKLIPSVSPKKTVEGFLAQFLYGFFIAVITLIFTNISYYGWFWCILLTLITTFYCVVGDLFESMLKRNADLKDSGKILPGHGGLLDRIDSLTAAAPVFVYCAYLFKNHLL